MHTCNGIEWNGLEWNGLDWNGCMCVKVKHVHVFEKRPDMATGTAAVTFASETGYVLVAA